jgi:hypothetical protein
MKNVDPKKFTQKKLRYYFRRIIARIQRKPRGFFEFKKMRGTCGIWSWDDPIKIDYRKPLIPTIIHEVLHDLYPDNWEGWTARVESKIVNILTPYDIYILLTAFFQKLDISPKPPKFAARKKRVKKTQLNKKK